MRSTAGMPYLHACLEEGLRMYPLAAVTPPRISPGATVSGEYIPKGVSPSIPTSAFCNGHCIKKAADLSLDQDLNTQLVHFPQELQLSIARYIHPRTLVTPIPFLL
jgi:hypothetical protein